MFAVFFLDLFASRSETFYWSHLNLFLRKINYFSEELRGQNRNVQEGTVTKLSMPIGSVLYKAHMFCSLIGRLHC